MTGKTELQQVTGWLADLANMTAGSAPLADSKSKIATMASMLADKFPVAAFCRQSLDAVAQECRSFPPYADVMKHLGAWWRAQRPAVAAIAPPPTDHYERYNLPKPQEAPTDAEKAAVAEMVAAWRHETAARHVSAALSVAGGQAKPVRKPAEMSDAQLLATFEALGQKGAARAAALRAKLATADSVPA